MGVMTNPLLLYVSRNPIFTEDEARLVYSTAGFFPCHLDIKKLEERLSDTEKPECRLMEMYFGYGQVMIFEYDQPFLGQKTQDFVEIAKRNLIDFAFLSEDMMAVESHDDVYAIEDIRSILPFAKQLVNDSAENSQNTDFLSYLCAKDFIASEALALITEKSNDTTLSAHQLFHNAQDYRVKYLFPSGVNFSSSFDEKRDVLSLFSRGNSQPVEGDLAFTRSQVRQLLSKGRQAVFATQHIDIEDLNFIRGLCSGVVVCEEKKEGEASFLDHLIEFPGLHFASNDGNHKLCVRDGGLEANQVRLEYGAHVVLDTENKRLITANASTDTAEPYPEYSHLFLRACDYYRKSQSNFKVFANVSSFRDIEEISRLGVDGIGLMRTESFFLKASEIVCLKKALLESDPSSISALQDYQYEKFLCVFKAFLNTPTFPITIRLIDPKPSELLSDADRNKLRNRVGLTEDPRGVQILKSTPDLYAAQSKAAFQAAQETGYKGQVKILVPFVSVGKEMEHARSIVEFSAQQTCFSGQFQVGAMLETFGSLKNIQDIVRYADFANIGPKDLTIEFLDGLHMYQMDEIKTLLRKRYGKDVPWADKHPFDHLHSKVQEKLNVALDKARTVKPNFEVIVCGDEVHDSRSSLSFALKKTNGISVPANRRNVAQAKLTVCNAILAQH